MLAALYRELGLDRPRTAAQLHGLQGVPAGLLGRAARLPAEQRARTLCGECRERAQLNPLRTFDCKVPALPGGPRRARPGCPTTSARPAPSTTRGSRRACDVQGIAFVEDHTLVRGMDYYTRTTFEFQSSLLGAQSGVGGGGRYDDLVAAIGGPADAGRGLRHRGGAHTAGARPLRRARRPRRRARRPTWWRWATATRGEVFALAHEMRTRGVAVELDYVGRSAKGQMKQAGRSGARYAFIIGEAGDWPTGTVTVRDLRPGEETRLSRGGGGRARGGRGRGLPAARRLTQHEEEDRPWHTETNGAATSARHSSAGGSRWPAGSSGAATTAV